MALMLIRAQQQSQQEAIVNTQQELDFCSALSVTVDHIFRVAFVDHIFTHLIVTSPQLGVCSHLFTSIHLYTR